MFSKVNSVGIRGVEGSLISVEADVSDGLPGFCMVGYLSSEVKEAQDRVRTALRNSGFYLPSKKITINLSPANIRKEGTSFDLPISIAVLAAYGIVDLSCLKDGFLAGELGLNGEIKAVHGVLSMVIAARDQGMKRCFLPVENVAEGSVVSGMNILGVSNLAKLVHHMNKPDQINWKNNKITDAECLSCDYDVDFGEVNGQKLLKRATEIAVSGRHNILYLGPAGGGKTMIARRIPTIMPALTPEENIEISKIYSVCGMLPSGSPLLGRRPFRSPHHTVSAQAMAGGGKIPKPGEISLASGGVLFLDEFPEFKRGVIEVLRQPLEEKKITISRVHGAYEFPANTMIVAAMNPCNCGFYPDRNRCHCSESQVKRYLSKISKPILDRIDICVEAGPVRYEEIKGRFRNKNETSETIRKRVEVAVKIQQERFVKDSFNFNGEMSGKEIDRYCYLKKEDEDFLQNVFSAKQLSVRGYEKILKVARTIADLEEIEEIQKRHLCEAIGYRNMEEKYWGGKEY